MMLRGNCLWNLVSSRWQSTMGASGTMGDSGKSGRRPTKLLYKRRQVAAEQTERQVVGVPLPRTLDLGRLHHSLPMLPFLDSAPRTSKYLEDADCLHITVNTANGAPDYPAGYRQRLNEVFVFEDGVLVFWDTERRLREDLRATLELYQSPTLDLGDWSAESWERFRRQETEFVEFRVEGSPSAASAGRVLLSRADDEPRTRTEKDSFVLRSIHDGSERFQLAAVQERFVLSHAVAMSVKLSVLEHQFTESNKTVDILIRSLRRGFVAKSHSENVSAIGHLFELKNAVNVGSQLTENPDLLWENWDLDRLHNEATNFFEIQSRKAALNVNHAAAIHFLELLISLDTNRRGHNLEIIIILLIAFEIFIALLDRFYPRA